MVRGGQRVEEKRRPNRKRSGLSVEIASDNNEVGGVRSRVYELRQLDRLVHTMPKILVRPDRTHPDLVIRMQLYAIISNYIQLY